MTMRAAAGVLLVAGMIALAGCNGQKDQPRGTTARSTVAALLRAIDQRNFDEVKKCYAQQDAYVQGLADLLNVSVQLQDETEKHINEGREQKKNLLPNGGPNQESFRQFANAAEQADGSDAVKLTSADGSVMKLVKQNGQWLIEDDGVGGSPDKREQAGRVLHELSIQIGQLVQDLKNGKYDRQDIKVLRNELAARQLAALGKAAGLR